MENRPNTSRKARSRVVGGRRILVAAVLVGALCTIATVLVTKGQQAVPEQLSVSEAQTETAPEVQTPVVPETPEPVLATSAGRIERGQSVSTLLSSLLSPLEIHTLAQTSKDVFSLNGMRAGRPYCIVTADGDFQCFEYEIDNDEKLVITKGDDGFDAKREAIPYDIRTAAVNGEVVSSLYNAVTASGEKAALAVRLANIFAWDVDFIRDIRKGDSFKVLVEKRYREGNFVGYGRITAAEFVNQGDHFRGFLFADKNGRETFYDAKGHSLRKAFLKAPLDFVRISSNFSRSRMHPILKIRRPHLGIDYAAPIGTPIRAVGDGVIIKRAWGKGAGRYVKIRHNGTYMTTYMHMSRFRKGVNVGTRVKQGQVIGYVGSTGYSTGPHLDFRMQKNGTYINPRRLKSPSAAPVAKDRMQAFREAIAPLVAQLDGVEPMQAAVHNEEQAILN